MGKSSSSKRKRSKQSSRVHSKKRSKVKRRRAKKLRRRDERVSYSSDDSGSSVSVSSTSEDSYRHRRSRSRSRKAVKRSKKSTRLHSSSSEESYRSRKRKTLKRNDGFEPRKKSYKRRGKKSRAQSISSRNSGSRTCSNCWSSSGSSGEESEYESSKGRSARRETGARKLSNVKSGATRRRYRSNSCSSCSRHGGDSDQWSEEKVITFNVPKRLKSVIILAKEDHDGRESKSDDHKQEVMCDHDYSPSGGSNDSNDGGNKRAQAHGETVVFESEQPLEIERKEDAPGCRKITELHNSGSDVDEHHSGSEPVGRNKISDASVDVNANDLESVLRQKALENLRRFRGGVSKKISTMDPKNELETTPKSPSPTKAEVNKIASLKGSGIQGDMKDSARSVQKEENIRDRKNDGDNSISAKGNVRKASQMADAGSEKANTNSLPVINRPRLVKSALQHALFSASSDGVDSTASQKPISTNLMTVNRVNKHDASPLKGNDDGRLANSASGSARDNFGLNKLQAESEGGSQSEPMDLSSVTNLSSRDKDTLKNNSSDSAAGAPTSQLTLASTDINSSKAQANDEGSQLQQKTMSVMRGGEMVQVSYKVYIPKKAPALARRQLKR